MSSIPSLGPTQPPVQWVQGLFPRNKTCRSLIWTTTLSLAWRGGGGERNATNNLTQIAAVPDLLKSLSHKIKKLYRLVQSYLTIQPLLCCWFLGVGWDWVYLVRLPVFYHLYQPRIMDDERGAIVGMTTAWVLDIVHRLLFWRTPKGTAFQRERERARVSLSLSLCLCVCFRLSWAVDTCSVGAVTKRPMNYVNSSLRTQRSKPLSLLSSGQKHQYFVLCSSEYRMMKKAQ
jgi:hypothetical protein